MGQITINQNIAGEAPVLDSLQIAPLKKINQLPGMIFVTLCFISFARVFFNTDYRFELSSILSGLLVVFFLVHFSISKARKMDHGRRVKWVGFFLVLPFLATAYFAKDFIYSAYYLVQLCLSILAAYVSSKIIDFQTFSKVTEHFIGISAIVGLILIYFGLGFQTFGDFDYARIGYYGIFGHKSIAGYLFALSCSLQLLNITKLKSLNLKNFVFFVASIISLAISDSRAGQGIFAISLVLIALSFLNRSLTSLGATLFIVLLTLMLIASPYLLTEIISFIPRSDSFLSGRTTIWLETIRNAHLSFPKPYGYVNYFGNSGYLHAIQTYNGGQYLPPHAHNSAIELLVDLGAFAIPVLFATAYYMLAMMLAARRNIIERNDLRLSIYLVFLLIPSIFDFSIYAHFSIINYIYYFLIFVTVSKNEMHLSTVDEKEVQNGLRKF